MAAQPSYSSPAEPVNSSALPGSNPVRYLVVGLGSRFAVQQSWFVDQAACCLWAPACVRARWARSERSPDPGGWRGVVYARRHPPRPDSQQVPFPVATQRPNVSAARCAGPSTHRGSGQVSAAEPKRTRGCGHPSHRGLRATPVRRSMRRRYGSPGAGIVLLDECHPRLPLHLP